MFQQFISKLRQIVRLDVASNTKDMKIGAVEDPEGKPQLAVQVPTGETIRFEPRAEAQLLSTWGVPPQHFERLPLELKQEELGWFARNAPRDLNFRTVQNPGSDTLVGRAVTSNRYTAYDSADVLEMMDGQLPGFEVTRADIQRDEMALVLTMPGGHDVSKRRVGDIVKSSITIGNSEVKTLSLSASASLFRLCCLNGLVLPSDGMSVRQRHIGDRSVFIEKLRAVLSSVAQVGEQATRRLQAARGPEYALPNLDPESGKLQRQVIGILRQASIWTQEFERLATEALGTTEEANLFGLIQILDGDFAKNAPIADRLHRERVAGKLLQLAA